MSVKRLSEGKYFVDVLGENNSVSRHVFDTKDELNKYIKVTMKVGSKIVSRGEC